MSSSKKLTCKGTLRQVFIRVYTMDTVSHVGIFYPALWTVAPLTVLSGSIPFPPLPRGGGGGELWVSGPQKDKNLPQSPFTSQLFYESYLSMPSRHYAWQNSMENSDYGSIVTYYFKKQC